MLHGTHTAPGTEEALGVLSLWAQQVPAQRASWVSCRVRVRAVQLLVYALSSSSCTRCPAAWAKMESMSFEPAAAPEPEEDGGSSSRWRRLRRRYRVGPRGITMGISGVLAFALLAVMLSLPVPYAVEGPGPTFNTLGKVQDHRLISIDGQDTYSSDGQLRLTTVTSAGGPGFPVNAGSVIRGWLSPDMLVQPAEAVFGPDLTEAERQHMTTVQMTSSQRNATAAALTALGYKVPATMTIVGAYPQYDAADVVQEGDVITGLKTDDGEHELNSYTQLAAVLADTAPDSTVT